MALLMRSPSSRRADPHVDFEVGLGRNHVDRSAARDKADADGGAFGRVGQRLHRQDLPRRLGDGALAFFGPVARVGGHAEQVHLENPPPLCARS